MSLVEMLVFVSIKTAHEYNKAKELYKDLQEEFVDAKPPKEETAPDEIRTNIKMLKIVFAIRDITIHHLLSQSFAKL